MALSMLITPPAEKFIFKTAHDYSPALRVASPRPQSKSDGPSFALNCKHASYIRDMTTPHRGLPHPAGLTLPDPHARSANERISYPHNITSAPPPPPPPPPTIPQASPQHQYNDEANRNSQLRGIEEERRMQEEEKSKQEELKLEQRRVEHSMLKDSIQAGVPPHLIPIIFAGISGGPLAASALDFAHHHLVQQLQQPAQPGQQHYPVLPRPQHEPRREVNPSAGRSYSFSTPTAVQFIQQSAPALSNAVVVPAMPPLQNAIPQTHHATGAYPSPAYQSPGRASSMQPIAPQIIPSQPQLSSLPRLTTNEAQVHSVVSNQQQDQASPSQAIYFHHWQPPGSQSASTHKESQKTSPKVASGGSTATDSSSASRKRKTQEPHHMQPAPGVAARSDTPPLQSSTHSSGRVLHSRPGSDGASRGFDPVGRVNRQIQRRSPSAELAKDFDKDSSPLRPSSSRELVPRVDRVKKDA